MSQVLNLRRPAGLVLAGGGSLGAWQAGALLALEEAGLSFDAVLGFSAGAINGSAYALGEMALARRRWLDCDRLLRPSPRLWPPSLFSARPLCEKFDFLQDEERARQRSRCRLVVASASRGQDRRLYAEFDAKRGIWDGPLVRQVLASCAIPLIFPPVRLKLRGREELCVDAGVNSREPFSLASLGHCADVLVIEMVLPRELERRTWTPWSALDRRGRFLCWRLIEEGAAELRRRDPQTRLLRLRPSRPLSWRMLDFSSELARQAAQLGEADARAFLEAGAP
ncbi:MAG: patatin-like phospholipase family protein [Elusimicrobia bacterium]|nr:patatin-like phospholipase family protein [Elusimicrobiota bacterium]MDE2424781.1 patatin-like phospholipase family protein [Elusimicrobiota bacterium]